MFNCWKLQLVVVAHAMACVSVSCAAAHADPYRLERTQYSPTVFKSPITPDYTEHWYRNLRNPNCCTMVLCNGACGYRGTGVASACTLRPLFPVLQANTGCGSAITGVSPLF